MNGDVTQLLERWGRGDRDALEELMPLVYDELRKLSRRYLRMERADHTLQSTALAHEAYLRLVGQDGAHWQNRAHFFAVAAQSIRHILVDHARRRNASKRGAGAIKLSLDEAIGVPEKKEIDLLALDEALAGLSSLDEQQGRIVELRYFGGLSIEETAEVLRISPATVKREWVMAKAWLYETLTNSAKPW
jgi:RNA polymerase sigma factor (TIGR02999 family)